MTTLSPPVRRTILLAHLACAGTWLGMDVVLGVPVLDAAGSAADPGSAVPVAAAASFGTRPLALVAVSPATARTHVSHAMIKLSARDRAQLVVVAYQSGLA